MFALSLSAAPTRRRLVDIDEKPFELVDGEIRFMVQAIQPILEKLRKSESCDSMEMITYEIVKDPEAGILTLINFKSEPFFPVANRERYIRMASNISGNIRREKTSVLSIDSSSGPFLVSACSGKWNVFDRYRNENYFEQVRSCDLCFFARRQVSDSLVRLIDLLPTIYREHSPGGKLVFAKVYTLIV